MDSALEMRSTERLHEIAQKNENQEENLFALIIMEDVVSAYTTKLERLKAYIVGFESAAQRRFEKVKFAFRKCEPHKDDFQEPMHDPLDCKLCEFNRIGMSDHLEIIFDYSDEVVKEFVKRWMFENIKNSCFEDDVNELVVFQH